MVYLMFGRLWLYRYNSVAQISPKLQSCIIVLIWQIYLDWLRNVLFWYCTLQYPYWLVQIKLLYHFWTRICSINWLFWCCQLCYVLGIHLLFMCSKNQSALTLISLDQLMLDENEEVDLMVQTVIYFITHYDLKIKIDKYLLISALYNSQPLGARNGDSLSSIVLHHLDNVVGVEVNVLDKTVRKDPYDNWIPTSITRKEKIALVALKCLISFTLSASNSIHLTF